jgi:hypothetical protein
MSSGVIDVRLILDDAEQPQDEDQDQQTAKTDIHSSFLPWISVWSKPLPATRRSERCVLVIIIRE